MAWAYFGTWHFGMDISPPRHFSRACFGSPDIPAHVHFVSMNVWTQGLFGTGTFRHGDSSAHAHFETISARGFSALGIFMARIFEHSEIVHAIFWPCWQVRQSFPNSSWFLESSVASPTSATLSSSIPTWIALWTRRRLLIGVGVSMVWHIWMCSSWCVKTPWKIVWVFGLCNRNWPWIVNIIQKPLKRN